MAAQGKNAMSERYWFGTFMDVVNDAAFVVLVWLILSGAWATTRAIKDLGKKL